MNLNKLQNSSTTLFFQLIIFYLVLSCSIAHIRLYFPPARQPAIDFLDNTRTGWPCGVSKPPLGQGIRSTIAAGEKINVTWFMAYSHIGGFTIELLDQNDQFMTELTSSGPLQTDRIATSFEVLIPANVECINCGIRLTREAKEWGNSYKFWSCADVDIRRRPGNRERCSHRGAFTDGICRCDRLYSGPACECKDECWSNQDCGINGECRFLTSRSFPNLACFCKPGWFGERCDRQNPEAGRPLPDSGIYKMREVGWNNKIYWRILPVKNEIEIVLQYPSNTWVAIGWKPLETSPSCAKRMLPTLLSPEESAVPESEKKPEPGSAPESPDFHVEPPSWLGKGISVLKPESDGDLKTEPVQRQNQVDQCMASWQWPKNCSSVYADCDYQISWASDGVAGEIVFVLEAKTPQFGWSGIGFSRDGKMPGSDMIIIKNRNGILTLEDMYSGAYSQPTRDITQNVYFHLHSNPALSYVNGVLRAEFKRLLNSRDVIEDATFSESNCFYFLYPTSGGRLSLYGVMSKHIKTPKVSESQICFEGCGLPRNKREVSTYSEPEPEPQGIPEPEGNTDNLHPMDCTDLVIGVVQGNLSRIRDSYTVSRASPREDEFYGGQQSLTAAYGYEASGVTTILFRKPLVSLDPTDHSITKDEMNVIWAKGQTYTDPDSNHKVSAYYEPNVLKYHGGKNRGSILINFYDD